jgi:hypothetical protein
MLDSRHPVSQEPTMTADRHLTVSGDDTARDNPLDVWARRFATGTAILIGVPLLVAGLLALLA